MTLRNKILLTGLPLLILPVAASLLVVGWILAGHARDERGAFLQSQVELIEARIAWDFDLLSRAGLQDDGKYRATVVKQLASSVKRLVGDEVEVMILSHQRQVLVGPSTWQDRTLTDDDPLAAVFLKTQGEMESSLTTGPSAARWLLAWNRFAEWNWTVVALVPMAQVEAPIVAALGSAVLASAGLLVVGVLVFLVFSRILTRPLRALRQLAQELGQGHFDLRAEVRGNDEVADLARQWNLMSDHLRSLTQGLEERVEERTRELEETLEASKTLHVQLLQAEKMAALGQLVAGVAHELSSPLSAIASAGSILRDNLDNLFPTLEGWSALSRGERDLVRRLLERGETSGYRSLPTRRADDQKALAALLEAQGCQDSTAIADGLVDAGLWELQHEEARSLSGARGPLVLNVLGALYSARFSGRIVESGVERAGKVIQALRDYSRFDTQRRTACVPLEESLDTVLTLLHSRLRAGIEVQRSLSADARVVADPDRLGQLWINLIGNAVQAMEGHGTLELRSEMDGPGLIVQIIDSGPGIPVELQAQIFKPYFTTKNRGEGTGLGLMICRSILEECGGTLSFESRPGRTVFEARFPQRC